MLDSVVSSLSGSTNGNVEMSELYGGARLSYIFNEVLTVYYRYLSHPLYDNIYISIAYTLLCEDIANMQCC
jgi:hypothetical protein